MPKSPTAARICPGLHSTHVVEELAVPCGPADLHDTRSDHSNFIVPHPSIHTKGATHTFERRGIAASLEKSKGMAAHHQCLKTTRDNRPLRRWNLSFLITAPQRVLEANGKPQESYTSPHPLPGGISLGEISLRTDANGKGNLLKSVCSRIIYASLKLKRTPMP